MALPFVTARGNRGGAFAAATGGGSTAATVTRSDVLEHHWKMDSSVEDATGNGADLTLDGASWDTTNKKFGSASLSFDGTDDWAYNSGGITAPSGAYTISCWLRFTDLPNGTLAGVLGINTSTTPDWDAGLTMLEHASVLKWYHAKTSSYNATTYSTNPTEDEWFFVAITWDDSTDDLKRYTAEQGDADPALDGTLGSVSTIRASLDSISLMKSQYNFSAGQMDDLRIYSEALSLAELKEIYNGGDGDY